MSFFFFGIANFFFKSIAWNLLSGILFPFLFPFPFPWFRFRIPCFSAAAIKNNQVSPNKYNWVCTLTSPLIFINCAAVCLSALLGTVLLHCVQMFNWCNFFIYQRVCSWIWNLESWALEYGILFKESWNPTNNWNPEFMFHWQRIRNLVPGIRNAWRGIQNPRHSWILFRGGMKVLFDVLCSASCKFLSFDCCSA